MAVFEPAHQTDPAMLRVLFLGDVVGHPGRLAIKQQLPALRERHKPHLVVINGENAANGTGLTPELYAKLTDPAMGVGADGVTLGDHCFKKSQIVGVLEREANIIRPANLPASAKGRGWMRLSATLDDRTALPVYVVTVLGRVYTQQLLGDDPFACVDRVIAQELPEQHPVVIVEMHAETTGEKAAMGWHCNGRVAAVLGTHTHIPTADARVLPPGLPDPDNPGGTGYITDLGMCGPYDSCLGRRADRVLHHMTTAMHAPYDVAEGDPRVCGVLLTIDPRNRRCHAIERIEARADPQAPPFRNA